jgi:uncharacterized protein YdeI (YjbR/CyaY-like superfamily)
MKPIFFSDQYKFRSWLEKNHDKKSELIVGFYKVNSGKKSLTWSESVDQALCFGWIDGIRRSIDENSYCIRFTPRKSSSIWSDVNIRKVAALKKSGLMCEAGLIAFNKRKENKSRIYSHEKPGEELPDELKKKLKATKEAWA